MLLLCLRDYFKGLRTNYHHLTLTIKGHVTRKAADDFCMCVLMCSNVLVSSSLILLFYFHDFHNSLKKVFLNWPSIFLLAYNSVYFSSFKKFLWSTIRAFDIFKCWISNHTTENKEIILTNISEIFVTDMLLISIAHLLHKHWF